MMQSAFCFRKKNISFSVSLFFCGGSTRSASADFVWIRERTSLRSQTLIIEAWRRRKSSQKRNVEPGADDDAATAIGDAPSPRRQFRCCPLPAPPARGLRLLAPGHPLSHAHPDLLDPRAQNRDSQISDEVERRRLCRWSCDARRRRPPRLAPRAL